MANRLANRQTIALVLVYIESLTHTPKPNATPRARLRGACGVRATMDADPCPGSAEGPPKIHPWERSRVVIVRVVLEPWTKFTGASEQIRSLTHRILEGVEPVVEPLQVLSGRAY